MNWLAAIVPLDMEWLFWGTLMVAFAWEVYCHVSNVGGGGVGVGGWVGHARVNKTFIFSSIGW